MPQLIVISLSVLLFGLVLKPVSLINAYFFIRPLVHPFAIEQLRLLGLPINWPFSLVMVLCAIVLFMLKRSFRLMPQNALFLYLITIISILSIVTSIDVKESIGQTIKYINAISILLIVSCVSNNKKNIIKVYQGIVISSIVPMIYGYYQYISGFVGYDLHGDYTSRITSFFGFPNLYGIYLSLVLFCCLILLFEIHNKRLRLVYLFIILSIVISSILALNRGSWISIVLGLLLSYPFYRRKVSIKWILIGISIVIFSASTIIINRFNELNEDRIGADTFSGRMELSQSIILDIATIPTLGYGSGTALQVLEKHYNVRNVPHNDYLRLLLEVGVIGPVLYIIFLSRELITIIRNREQTMAWHINYFTMAMLIYFIIISFVQNIIHDVLVFPLFLVCFHLAKQYILLERYNKG